MKTYTVSINMEVSGIEADSKDMARSELIRLITEDRSYRNSAWEYTQIEDEEGGEQS